MAIGQKRNKVSYWHVASDGSGYPGLHLHSDWNNSPIRLDIHQRYRIDQIFHWQHCQYNLCFAVSASPQPTLPCHALHSCSGEGGKTSPNDENERHENSQLLAGLLHLQFCSVSHHQYSFLLDRRYFAWYWVLPEDQLPTYCHYRCGLVICSNRNGSILYDFS